MSRIAGIGHLLAVASAAAILFSAQAEEAPERHYAQLVAARDAGLPLPPTLEVEVDLAALPGLSIHLQGEFAEVRYPMVFNNVAEGWNWNPLADPSVEDYYRYKYLPLQSFEEQRGEYDGEDKIGVVEHRRVVWRYDYFLAFANLYDFYPRSTDDAAGFAARVPAGLAARVAVRALARPIQPWVAESSTFWKATYGKPVDFTLKKRYLMAELLEVRFVDRENGAVLAVVRPLVQR